MDGVGCCERNGYDKCGGYVKFGLSGDLVFRVVLSDNCMVEVVIGGLRSGFVMCEVLENCGLMRLRGRLNGMMLLKIRGVYEVWGNWFGLF